MRVRSVRHSSFSINVSANLYEFLVSFPFALSALCWSVASFVIISDKYNFHLLWRDTWETMGDALQYSKTVKSWIEKVFKDEVLDDEGDRTNSRWCSSSPTNNLWITQTWQLERDCEHTKKRRVGKNGKLFQRSVAKKRKEKDEKWKSENSIWWDIELWPSLCMDDQNNSTSDEWKICFTRERVSDVPSSVPLHGLRKFFLGTTIKRSAKHNVYERGQIKVKRRIGFSSLHATCSTRSLGWKRWRKLREKHIFNLFKMHLKLDRSMTSPSPCRHLNESQLNGMSIL